MGPTDILQPSPPKVGDEASVAGKKLSVDEIEQALEKVKQGQGSGRGEQMPMGYGSATTRGYGR